jgi:monothiol glutaredoxin
MDVKDRIHQQVTGHPVVLYMKGTPQFPMCGFSATATEILKRSGVTDYLAVNVLDDPEIRQGIKEYANWPTIPQLYVNGEFRHHARDVPERRAQGRAREDVGLTRRPPASGGAAAASRP